MHDVIEVVRRVDYARDSAKNKNEQACKQIGEQPAIFVEVGKFRPPSDEAATAPLARAVL